MNPSKIKYSRERAAEIKEGLIGNLRAQMTGDLNFADIITTDQARAYFKTAVEEVLSDEGMDKLLKQVFIKTEHGYENSRGGWGDYATLKTPDVDNTLEKLMKNCPEALAVKRENEQNELDLENRIKAIEAEHNRVMDLVVLGDEEEARQALAAFASFAA